MTTSSCQPSRRFAASFDKWADLAADPNARSTPAPAPGVAPFYLAIAYEGVARAASVREDWSAAATALEQARALAQQVDDAEDCKVLLGDLAKVRIAPGP